jgi:hypothetical protein
MIRKARVAGLPVASATGIACAAPQMDAQYSEAEVKAMVRGAHTALDYKALATYFNYRQKVMKQKAKAATAEWGRCSQITTGIYQEYLRPADSSRNRYEYFTHQTNQMGQQATHDEQL